jgi:hypothetical protein
MRRSFYGAGQESSSKPPAQNSDMFTLLQNILPASPSGVLLRRWGYTQMNSAAGIVARRAYEYQKDADGSRRIIATAGDGTGASGNNNKVVAFNEDGTSYNSSIMVPAAGARSPRIAMSRDYAYIFDGVAGDNKKWDGSSSGGTSKTGITAPATAISVGSPTSGSITLVSGRNYFLVFKNSTTGNYSGLSPVSPSTGPVTSKQIPLSNLAVSADSQVDKKEVLATADGGDQTTLYFVTELANATTTYTDTTPEISLLTNNIYLETDDAGIEHGVADNDPPPALDMPIKHKGRLFGVSGQILHYSKSLDELVTSTGIIAGRYEECWPADNQIDVSEGAETVQGLLSDGEVLWIATERHIRRLYGSSAVDFGTPAIAFNEVGVLNKETWTPVFIEGSSVGVMWLTPDFKVIGSDFNTYKDVGAPIQDLLDSINTVQSDKCSSMYLAYGNYDLYLLAIPTGGNTEPDTLCVYDLKGKKWYVWIPTDTIAAQLFNIPASGKPQAIFWTSTAKMYKWDPTQTQDRVGGTPVSFAATGKTNWLDFEDPSARKTLNEIEVSGDSALTVTVDGASKASEFASPTSVIGATALVASPFGELKVYLAGSTSKDRFYQFTFSATSTSSTFLQSYSIEAAPLHRL